MFAYLIQERIEEPSLSSVFYDQAVRVLTGLGLNSLTGDKRTNLISVLDRQTIVLSEKDSETPLFTLVACFNELANVFSVSRKPWTLSDILENRKRKPYLRTNTLESSGSYDNTVENGYPKFIEKRHELAQTKHGYDLQLDDMGKGPLIIPGPSKVIDHDHLVGSVEDLSEDDFELELEMERPSSVRYRYSGGWPNLDISLLESAQNSQQGLDLLRMNRIKSLKQVPLLLSPSPLSDSSSSFIHSSDRSTLSISSLFVLVSIESVINLIVHYFVQFKWI
jgi:hypothetical protein